MTEGGGERGGGKQRELRGKEEEIKGRGRWGKIERSEKCRERERSGGRRERERDKKGETKKEEWKNCHCWIPDGEAVAQ